MGTCKWCGCYFDDAKGVDGNGKTNPLGLNPIFFPKYCGMRCYTQATGGKENQAQAKIAEQERIKAQNEAMRAEAERKRQERLAFEAELKSITETEFSSDEESYENEIKAFLRLYMQDSYWSGEKWFMPNWMGLYGDKLKKKKAYENRLKAEFQFMESDKPELYKKLFPSFNEEVNKYPIMTKNQVKHWALLVGCGTVLLIALFIFIGISGS
jgi:hypothetical protein